METDEKKKIIIKLRKETGWGFMDIKKALNASDWNAEEAKVWLSSYHKKPGILFQRDEYNSYKPSKETVEKNKRAYDAMMAYEKNCMSKYDRTGKPSLMPQKGDTMLDFAGRYGTTISEMKKALPEVEYNLESTKFNCINVVDGFSICSIQCPWCETAKGF